MSPETLNDRQSEAPEQPPVSGAPGQEAVPGAVPDQAQSNFDWFSRGPNGGGNAAPEAPTAQVQPESTAEQHDAQVRYSDAELLGNRYAVHLKVQGAGNRAVTLARRFCTSTWARSGSVPGSNVTVSCACPLESLTDS